MSGLAWMIMLVSIFAGLLLLAVGYVWITERTREPGRHAAAHRSAGTSPALLAERVDLERPPRRSQ